MPDSLVGAGRAVATADEGCVVGSTLLYVALSNLVPNAIDFSAEDGRIRIIGKKIADRIELCVEDEVPGIPSYCPCSTFRDTIHEKDCHGMVGCSEYRTRTRYAFVWVR